MDTPTSELFNLVVLPTTSAEVADQKFQLSATSIDRSVRMVSPEWSEREVRSAFAAGHLTLLQVEELFRGNSRAYPGRNPRKLLFTEQQLFAIGLHEFSPEPDSQPEQSETDVHLSDPQAS